AVERHHRKDRPRGCRDIDARQTDEMLRSSDRLRREVRIRQNQIITMTHGAQHPEQIWRQDGIYVLQHHYLPGFFIVCGVVSGYSPYGTQMFFTWLARRRKSRPCALAAVQSRPRP